MDSNHSSYSYASMNKSLAQSDISTTEESGWTAYFDDFMTSQQQAHHNHSFSHHHDHYNQDYQPELSDAASHIEWTSIANSKTGSAPKFTKKLNLFKKTSRRTKEILYDDSLEDTASSPVNSPKVGSQHMGFNQIKGDDIMENSLEKRGRFDDQSRPMMFEENNGGTDLRKRGLCLVPVSMFVNYI
ncbi:vascular-related unknown protein 1-like [Bidens hawaiensis]|uniref:vascular-related unknown protein 1-like n=1 Tax=Bidens hawaiensis TaxID=980011 RepID=UPI00404A61EC